MATNQRKARQEYDRTTSKRQATREVGMTLQDQAKQRQEQAQALRDHYDFDPDENDDLSSD